VGVRRSDQRHCQQTRTYSQNSLFASHFVNPRSSLFADYLFDTAQSHMVAMPAGYFGWADQEISV
jgi:hypothetical protein